ncbi:hypothetical protein ESZ50_02160 [Weissella muntiaci]|uniref:Uncharacterized protein n=1 Tax=Weissella muntiaci TaxID=2508881 RepID=A0A6C2C8Z7_9LACO|nr:hypothetical protein [Weissella muntiaci]TYC50491.1 hypothetical protein ESZ50_02160 [Weissella muntiaci]
MSTRLEIAIKKMHNLESELENAQRLAREASNEIPFGQPNIIGRKNIYRDVQHYHNKVISLDIELEDQKKYVEKLQQWSDNKDSGRRKDGNVDFNNVANIEMISQMIADLELEKIERKAKGDWTSNSQTKLRTWKKKLSILEDLKAQSEIGQDSMSSLTKRIIDSGRVKRWDKKPMFYFVQGLQKVALQLTEQGEFVMSSRYAAKNEDDLKIVNSLLEM